jgi:microcystin-dependent protein
MSDQFIGQLRYFGFNFPPKGWALANGQLLSIQQNAALFSILGTFYGGNGTTNFALPNMQSRTPLHQGQGLGLSDYVVGQISGAETTTLLSGNLPNHTHLLVASTSDGTAQTPQANDLLAKAVSGGGSMVPDIYAPFTGTNSANLAAAALGTAGQSQPMPIIQPYLVINCSVALFGVFPSRN